MRKLPLALLLLPFSPAWGQLDIHETFEGSGSGCAIVETWTATPSTIDTDSSLTGSCNLLNPSATNLATGLGLDSLCIEFQFRNPTDPSAAAFISRLTNSSNTTTFSMSFSTGRALAIGHGTTGLATVATLTNNTNYTIEWCTQRSLGSGSATKARINGGSFVEQTGSTTDVIDRWRPGSAPDTDVRIDEIKMCYGTYDGVSACDPPPAAAQIFSHAVVVEGFYPDPFDIQPQSLPDGAPEEVYPGAQFVALNGNPPHTWAVSGGALPDGLSLSSGGALTGTPAMGEGGTHNFTVRATDADGGLAYRDFSVVVQSDPDPVQQLWERDFTILRTHYVEASGGCTSGGTCGGISNPETLAHALSHDQAGDLHILRGGTYTGNSTMSADGTSTNPIIWKCFINSNGDPENCNVDGSWKLSGDWNWVWAMNNEDATTTQTQSAFQLEARGTAFINSRVVRYPRGTGLDAFPFGPDMVVYGATLITNGWDNRVSAPRHNTYTQNIYDTHGWKYYVQVVSLDQPDCVDCPNAQGPMLFNNGFSPTGGGRGTGFHIQDSTFQYGRINISQHTGFNTGNPPVSRIRWHQNWYDTGIANAYFRTGDQVPAQMQFTDSLFRNTRFENYRYWGASDACFSYFSGEHSIFTGNKFWSPIGGKYMKLSARNYNGSCGLNTLGAAKIRDVDEWDNNTYGPSGAGNTFDINANGSNLTGRTLAQWRTGTGDARETGGGADFDLSSTETALPTTDQVECFDNFYEPGWGYCRAIDWDGNGSITIPAAEAQKIVGNGKTYKVRNARDFHGTPLKSGTYTTGAGIASITLPEDSVNDVLLVWITSQP